MVPYTNEEHEYREFKINYLDKLIELGQDFGKLSEDNKTRVMIELSQIVPPAFLNLKRELNARLKNK